MLRAMIAGGEALELQLADDLDSIHDAWERITTDATNIFATWDWNSVWWRHYGGGRKLLATVCSTRDGELVGLLPLYFWRQRPLRIMRLLGHNAGDELAPICRESDRGRVADAIPALASRCRADLFLGDHVPVEERWAPGLGAISLARHPSPSLALDFDSYEQFLETRAGRFLRRGLAVKQRRLARTHDVRFRLTSRPEDLSDDLDTLFALHRLRWDGKPTTFGQAERFHRDFAARALERGWLRLWLLEVNGQPRAAWYGFRFGGVESFYQGGRDVADEWKRHSVGSLLMLHSIRSAIEDRMHEYRFLLGGETYKFEFTESDRAVETIAWGEGVAARLSIRAAMLARRIRMLGGLSTA